MCKLLFETGSCLFGRTDYSAPRPVLQTLAGNVTELDIFNQIQSLRFFRSAMRTSYYLRSHSEFSILSTCPVLQEKSRSPLQPYKSSQDHCQHIKREKVKKGKRGKEKKRKGEKEKKKKREKEKKEKREKEKK